MNELEEIMNGKREMRCFRIEGDTIGFDTLRSANWNLTPRDIETIIYTLQEDKNNLQSKIDKVNQYLEEHFIFDDKNGEYYQTHTFDKDNVKELHDILKEDK